MDEEDEHDGFTFVVMNRCGQWERVGPPRAGETCGQAVARVVSQHHMFNLTFENLRHKTFRLFEMIQDEDGNIRIPEIDINALVPFPLTRDVYLTYIVTGIIIIPTVDDEETDPLRRRGASSAGGTKRKSRSKSKTYRAPKPVRSRTKKSIRRGRSTRRK